MVGGLYDIKVMLDDQHSIPGRNECMEHLQKLMDVGKMKAGGRLVENIESFACSRLGKLSGKLYSLGLAA